MKGGRSPKGKTSSLPSIVFFLRAGCYCLGEGIIGVDLWSNGLMVLPVWDSHPPSNLWELLAHGTLLVTTPSIDLTTRSRVTASCCFHINHVTGL